MASSERELTAPNGNKRDMRRDEKGRFKESERSLSQDHQQHASTQVKSGHDDRGEQKRR